MGHLKLPEGKKIAVNLGTDFDAQSLWLGGYNKPSPSYMSRGEFGAMVGVPRLLETYERYGITTTWFTPDIRSTRSLKSVNRSPKRVMSSATMDTSMRIRH